MQKLLENIVFLMFFCSAVFSLAYYHSFTMICTDLLQVTKAVGGSKSQLEARITNTVLLPVDKLKPNN
jgi:hypothetical protein